MITMGFKNNIDEFTNLAYLFSNQYDVETKVAVFQDVDRSIFKSKKEFNSSILKQINDVLDYVHLCNETRIVISVKEREEYDSYPNVALREAILNCYWHRDYNRKAKIKIDFFANRCEIISPGRFYDGMTIEKALIGNQTFRNKKLVRLLFNLKLVENYASGFERIYKAYVRYYKNVEVINSDISLKVILPNLNYNYFSNKNNYNHYEEIIVGFLKEHKSIRRTTVEDLLEIKATKAKKIIIQVGNGPSTTYRLND